jgi:hypothetical protein
MTNAVFTYGGTQIRYTEYPGVGHNVWDYVAKESTVPKWLLAQRKGSSHNNPAKINNFRGEVLDGNKIRLHWDLPSESPEVSDNNIWYCRIFRNGDVIKEVYNDQNSFTDSTRVENTEYEYTISAVNYYFKESEKSESINFP